VESNVAMGALALKRNSNAVSMAQTCINAHGESGEMEFGTTARKLRSVGATVGDSIKERRWWMLRK